MKFVIIIQAITSLFFGVAWLNTYIELQEAKISLENLHEIYEQHKLGIDFYKEDSEYELAKHLIALGYKKSEEKLIPLDKNALREVFLNLMDSQNLSFQFTGHRHVADLLEMVVDSVCSKFGTTPARELTYADIIEALNDWDQSEKLGYLKADIALAIVKAQEGLK